MKDDKLKVGKGLLEVLQDENVVPYEPVGIDGYLTKEEREQFDHLDWSDEEKELAVEMYARLMGKEVEDGIDVMVRMLQDIWYDREPVTDRKITMYVSAESKQLFDDYINELANEHKTKR